MRKTLALFLVLVATSLTASADALWDKAVALVEATQGWVARTTIDTTLDLNEKGVVIDTTVSTTVNSFDKKGWPARQKIKVVKNGKDETPDAVAKASAPPKGPTDPLQASAQAVTKVSSPVDGTWNGKAAKVYSFVFLPPGGTGLQGKIWLDPQTAVPVHRESVLAPVPLFVEAGSFVQEQALDPRGFLVWTKQEVEFRGSFLGFKKHYKISSVYQDWVKRDAL